MLINLEITGNLAGEGTRKTTCGKWFPRQVPPHMFAMEDDWISRQSFTHFIFSRFWWVKKSILPRILSLAQTPMHRIVFTKAMMSTLSVHFTRMDFVTGGWIVSVSLVALKKARRRMPQLLPQGSAHGFCLCRWKVGRQLHCNVHQFYRCFYPIINTFHSVVIRFGSPEISPCDSPSPSFGSPPAIRFHYSLPYPFCMAIHWLAAPRRFGVP